MNAFRQIFFSVFVGALLVLGACGAPNNNNGTLSQEAQTALKETLMDEFKAEATYKKVLATFNDATPFKNIINAETTHAQALLKVYTTYSLQPPANPWQTSTDGIPDFATLQDACKAGVQAEIDNVALYDKHLALTLPDDLRTVFTSLRDASQDKHLPAFQKCAGN